MTYSKYIYGIVIGLCLLGFSETVSAQFDIPPVPPKKDQTSLYDYINELSSTQNEALKSKLLRYADSTSTQIVVAIIATTQGEDISFLGAKWGQKWGIGQADEDNGIFILLAKEDRKIDINTGYGIEYRISDRDAEQIINRIMVPHFKNENYYAGLNDGADAIFQALNGEFTEDRDFTAKDIPMDVIIIIIFIILWIILSTRRRGGGRGGGTGSLLDVIILSNMGRTSGGGWSSGSSGGGWSSGGGSSGGFGGGFGGGGFGGGGASGGW